MATLQTSSAPSAESLSPTRGLPADELYPVGEDDDGADTSSLRRVEVAQIEAESAKSAESIGGAELHDTAPRPAMTRRHSVPMDEIADDSADETADVVAVTASLEAADAHTLRPSQGSLSRMLAAPEDSVVTSGLLTQADALIGTPMYMAPELWNTGSHRAEPLSDIFSIGVIAFELLTGRMPFAVPPVMSRANDEPIYITRLSQVRPDLEPRLIALVESCLSLEPTSRLRASELTRRLIELGAQLPQS